MHNVMKRKQEIRVRVFNVINKIAMGIAFACNGRGNSGSADIIELNEHYALMLQALITL